MHHENHDGGGCTKCVINRKLVLAATDTLASAASAAETIRVIIDGAPSNFHGCEHAAKLVAMIKEIVEDIDEMVGSGGRP